MTSAAPMGSLLAGPSAGLMAREGSQRGAAAHDLWRGQAPAAASGAGTIAGMAKSDSGALILPGDNLRALWASALASQPDAPAKSGSTASPGEQTGDQEGVAPGGARPVISEIERKGVPSPGNAGTALIPGKASLSQDAEADARAAAKSTVGKTDAGFSASTSEAGKDSLVRSSATPKTGESARQRIEHRTAQHRPTGHRTITAQLSSGGGVSAAIVSAPEAQTPDPAARSMTGGVLSSAPGFGLAPASIPVASGMAEQTLPVAKAHPDILIYEVGQDQVEDGGSGSSAGASYDFTSRSEGSSARGTDAQGSHVQSTEAMSLKDLVPPVGLGSNAPASHRSGDAPVKDRPYSTAQQGNGTRGLSEPSAFSPEPELGLFGAAVARGLGQPGAAAIDRKEQATALSRDVAGSPAATGPAATGFPVRALSAHGSDVPRLATGTVTGGLRSTREAVDLNAENLRSSGNPDITLSLSPTATRPAEVRSAGLETAEPSTARATEGIASFDSMPEKDSAEIQPGSESGAVISPQTAALLAVHPVAMAGIRLGTTSVSPATAGPGWGRAALSSPNTTRQGMQSVEGGSSATLSGSQAILASTTVLGSSSTLEPRQATPADPANVRSSGSSSPFQAIDIGEIRPQPQSGQASGRIAGHTLAVGYDDPALGYVELQAHGSGSGIHASLVADSPASGAVLAGHLGSLTEWMQDRRTVVESLTVLAHGHGSGDTSGLDGRPHGGGGAGAGRGDGFSHGFSGGQGSGQAGDYADQQADGSAEAGFDPAGRVAADSYAVSFERADRRGDDSAWSDVASERAGGAIDRPRFGSEGVGSISLMA